MATSPVAAWTSAVRAPSTSRVVRGPGHLFSHLRRRLLPASSCRPESKRLCAQSSVVDGLNATHGISGHVQFVPGPGNLPVAKLTHACGASAQVSLFGGQVLSWRQASGDEVLFVRPDAVFDKSKPIAGGIPHCFPQFGPGHLPQHGFARLSEWSVASSSADPQPDDRDPEVQLTLTDSEQTRAAWPHCFQCAFSVSLHGESLRLDLRVVNVDSHAWSFTTALHSYFEVADLAKAAVRGLAGLTYLDKTRDVSSPPRQTESRRQVTFEKAVDSVFLGASDYAEVCVGNGAAISISSSGFPDMVVWNPGPSVPCYAQFVCAENAVAGEPIELQPGESWRGQVALAVIDRPLHAA